MKVLAAYAVTKGEIDSMAKHLAAVLGQRSIRVNAVAPGFINTDIPRFM